MNAIVRALGSHIAKGLGCWLVGGSVWAQGVATGDAQREQRDQIEQVRRQAQRQADLPGADASTAWLPPVAGEEPCVHLKRLTVTVSDDGHAAPSPPVPWPLRVAPSDYLSACVGAINLQRLRANLQNQLQALGYITSTLSLTEQNLHDGELQLRLHWGRVGQVHMDVPAADSAWGTAPAPHALAVQPGQVLNLRDIEHTLETLARLPSQAARFVIEPSTQPYTSDLRVLISPQRPWRATLGLEAADLRRHSPWDVQAHAWLDAPMGWSEQWMFFASGTPSSQGEQRAQRHSLYAAWSLPWRRHLVTISASTARNSRSIAGGVGRFVERGQEQQATLRWQWTPWRGANWRTQVWATWAERRSRSHIDDVELLSRRRVAAELGLGASHWQKLGCGTASVELDATHTRRLARVAEFQDLLAPKPRQWRVQADWQCAWVPRWPGNSARPAPEPWAWTLSAWSQAVERPFDGTDLLTLGSRYTVRGHSPEQALQGRRISVLRLGATAPGQRLDNGLAWQAWLGWDLGHLDKPAAGLGASANPSRTRQATTLGLRWQAGSASGEASWSRPTGPTPLPRRSLWQAQAAWQF